MCIKPYSILIGMVPEIFYICHSVGAVHIDHIDNVAYAQ